MQLRAFTIAPTALVNLEPPLSTATRLRRPEKMIAIPAPTNHSESVFMWNGKAKLICVIPKRIMATDIILIILCTTFFIHLDGRALNSAITAKHTTIAGLRL